MASAKQVDALIAAAGDLEPEIRARVASALGKSGELRAVPALQQLAMDSVWYVRLHAIKALCDMRQLGVRETYLRALEDEEWRVREKAALGLYYSSDNAEQLFAFTAAIPHGHDMLVSTLDRQGVTWNALEGLASDIPEIKNKSRALIVTLVKTSRVASVLSGIKSHPQKRVRQELACLVIEYSTPELRSQCRQMIQAGNSLNEQTMLAEPRFAAVE